MMSLQARLRAFGAELATLGDAWHYRKPEREAAPYTVWAEDGEGDTALNADNRKEEQVIHGYIDYFTLSEYDERVDQIQELLYQKSSWWHLNSVQYEEETNLIHYAWEFNL